MCDYSLMGVPNRLAKDGEVLVLYTFSTGTKGFTPSMRITYPKPPTRGAGLWERLKNLFQKPNPDCATAVCIPPGARLMIEETPVGLQRMLNLGDTELVMFSHLSSDSDIHRDALRFGNGAEISLQDLPEGLRVRILGLDLHLETTPVQGDGATLRLG